MKDSAEEDRKEQQPLFREPVIRFQDGSCAAKGSNIGSKYRRVVGDVHEKVGLWAM